MSSAINIDNINATFPQAGVDNSSQGFRDNYNAIKLAFTTATSEISDLQLNTAKLNVSNDFGFAAPNQQVKLQKSGFTAINAAAITGVIDFAAGSYHKSAITTSTTFNVTNWPSSANSVFAQVRLEVAPVSTASMVINFSASPGTLVKLLGEAPHTSTTQSSTVWDLWSTDGGATVFVKLVGGPFV